MSFALPECRNSPTEDRSVSNDWDDCEGIRTYASGDKYVGEFRDGKRNGLGTYSYASGNKYVGEYRDGKRHGRGHLFLCQWRQIRR